MKKWVLRHNSKTYFSVFWTVWCAFGLKDCKKCWYDRKNIFFQIFSIWVRKNAEFDADFKSVGKKSSIKVFTKKVTGLITFLHSTKSWKSKSFVHFLLKLFYTFFNGFEICIKFCVFWHPFKNNVKKIFLGHIGTFCQLWSLKHTKRLKTRKIFFSYTWIRINYIFQFWFRTNKMLKSFHPIVHIKFAQNTCTRSGRYIVNSCVSLC